MTDALKPCGDCTACCEGWLADASLGMYPGKHCTNLENGECTIYEERPEHPCRSFNCMWRKTPFLSEEMRPDKSGAIVVATKIADWPLLQVVPMGETRPPEAVLHRAMLMAARAQIPVAEVSRDDDGSVNQTIYGPPAFTEAVKGMEFDANITVPTETAGDESTAGQIIASLR